MNDTLKESNRSCCVPKCMTKGYPVIDGKLIRYHLFPSHYGMKRLWMIRTYVNAETFKSGNEAFVCSLHFMKDDYIHTGYSRPRLKPDAVPSQFKCWREEDEDDSSEELDTTDTTMQADDEKSDGCRYPMQIKCTCKDRVPIPRLTSSVPDQVDNDVHAIQELYSGVTVKTEVIDDQFGAPVLNDESQSRCGKNERDLTMSVTKPGTSVKVEGFNAVTTEAFRDGGNVEEYVLKTGEVQFVSTEQDTLYVDEHLAKVLKVPRKFLKTIVEFLAKLIRKSKDKEKDMVPSIDRVIRERHACRCVINASSETYRDLYYDSCRSIFTVNLKDIGCFVEDMDNAVNFIYTGKITLSLDNTERMLRLAGHLHLHEIVSMCEMYLWSVRSVKNSNKILQILRVNSEALEMTGCLTNTRKKLVAFLNKPAANLGRKSIPYGGTTAQKKNKSISVDEHSKGSLDYGKETSTHDDNSYQYSRLEETQHSLPTTVENMFVFETGCSSDKVVTHRIIGYVRDKHVIFKKTGYGSDKDVTHKITGYSSDKGFRHKITGSGSDKGVTHKKTAYGSDKGVTHKITGSGSEKGVTHKKTENTISSTPASKDLYVQEIHNPDNNLEQVIDMLAKMKVMSPREEKQIRRKKSKHIKSKNVTERMLESSSQELQDLFSKCCGNLYAIDLDELGYNANEFESVLDFVYTGRISLLLSNIENVLNIAAYFEIHTLLDVCEKYLTTMRDVKTCQKIFIILCRNEKAVTMKKGLREMGLEIKAFLSKHMTPQRLLRCTTEDIYELMRNGCFSQRNQITECLRFACQLIKARQDRNVLKIVSSIVNQWLGREVQFPMNRSMRVLIVNLVVAVNAAIFEQFGILSFINNNELDRLVQEDGHIIEQIGKRKQDGKKIGKSEQDGKSRQDNNSEQDGKSRQDNNSEQDRGHYDNRGDNICMELQKKSHHNFEQRPKNKLKRRIVRSDTEVKRSSIDQSKRPKLYEHKMSRLSNSELGGNIAELNETAGDCPETGSDQNSSVNEDVQENPRCVKDEILLSDDGDTVHDPSVNHKRSEDSYEVSGLHLSEDIKIEKVNDDGTVDRFVLQVKNEDSDNSI